MQLEKPAEFDASYGDFLQMEKSACVSGRLFPELCSDIALLILEDLDFKTLGKCSVLNHDWCTITRHYFAERKIEVCRFVFGPDDWNYYSGKKFIPYNEEKDAFRCLSPIVDTVENVVCWMYKGFSIIHGGLFLKEFYPENEDQGYTHISPEIVEKYGRDKITKPYWFIVSRSLVPDSLHKTYQSQKFFLEKFKSLNDGHCQAPELSEMIVAMSAEWIKFKKILFKSYYTRCHMTVEHRDRESEVIISMFDDGLYIYYLPVYFNRRDIGLATVQKSLNPQKLSLINKRFSLGL